MWHILWCLTRDRWASHHPGSTVMSNVCEWYQHTLGYSVCRLIWILWGLIGQLVCAPSWVGVEWACLRSRCNQQYYLYNMRGLTGFGLMLFHPNIIILWLGIIGLGWELVMLLHMQFLCWILWLYLLTLQMCCDVFIASVLLWCTPSYSPMGS